MIITDKSQITTSATIPTTQSAPSKHACEMSVKIIQSSTTKGQLISKCPFGVIAWTKVPTKNLTISALEFENHKIKALYNVFNT